MYLLQYTGTQQAATEMLEKHIEKPKTKAIKSVLSTSFQVQNQQRNTSSPRSQVNHLYLIKFVVSIQVQIGNEAST